MNCFSNRCFLCLKYKDIVNCLILQHAESDIVQRLQFVLPEIVILEPRQPLLICSTCRQSLDKFHNFKKMCLDNYCLYNDYINNLQTPNDSSEQEFNGLQDYRNENKLLSNVKKEENIDLSTQELEADENLVGDATDVKEIEFKEESSISEESIDPFYQQIVKKETNSENVHKCERNITIDKIYSNQQEVTKDMCQATDLKCSVCNEIFVEKSHFLKHMMMIHTSIKEKKCFICNKMFTATKNLKRHMTTHSDLKDYKCLICNKMFNMRSTLKRHTTTHTGAKDYKCLICNKMFRQSATLKYHMRIHTGVKNYKCSICNKMFSRRANLETHMKIHTGAKDYKCSICNKMFNTNANLKYHMATHTGIKDYKCSICNKLFVRKSNLKSHVATHTSVKKYICLICNKMFKMNINLDRHMKLHKGVYD